MPLAEMESQLERWYVASQLGIPRAIGPTSTCHGGSVAEAGRPGFGRRDRDDGPAVAAANPPPLAAKVAAASTAVLAIRPPDGPPPGGPPGRPPGDRPGPPPTDARMNLLPTAAAISRLWPAKRQNFRAWHLPPRRSACQTLPTARSLAIRSDLCRLFRPVISNRVRYGAILLAIRPKGGRILILPVARSTATMRGAPAALGRKRANGRAVFQP